MKIVTILIIAAATAVSPLLWRDGDRLQPPLSRAAHAVGAVDTAGRSVRVDGEAFTSGNNAEVIIYQSGDTLFHVQDATRHICLLSSDTLSYLGFENRATSLVLDSPLTVLRYPLRGGDTFAEEWSGTVFHRGRTLLRKVVGRSASRIEKDWRIVEDGDTLPGATLLRWELGMSFAAPDSLDAELPDTVVSPSVSDLMLPSDKLLSESMLTLREVWFSPSARYPVLQRSGTFRVVSGKGTPADTVPLSGLAIRYPADLQRMDTGEEFAPANPDEGGGEPLLTLCGGDGPEGGFPVDLKNPEIGEGGITVTLASPNGSRQARMTLFSVSGIPLSETVTLEVGVIPQTYTIHAHAGTSGVVLLRVDAGDLSRTYKAVL